LAAVFGGSSLQVSGPTGAMTVVLVPIMHAHGASGVLTVGLLAGLILIGLAIARAGSYMAFVPASVIEGFNLGIACIIGLQQLPAALGSRRILSCSTTCTGRGHRIMSGGLTRRCRCRRPGSRPASWTLDLRAQNLAGTGQGQR
jgi:hypothetical protein